jgi:NitT/TauT family transport system permease protein
MSRVAWIRLGVVAAAVGLLEFFCRIGAVNHRILIAPSEMAVAMLQILVSGQANAEMARTFGTVIVSVAISIALGLVVGLVVHSHPRVRQALDPFFATYYAVPVFIFYPVMIAIFGLSVVPIILMGVASAAVAVIIATLNGLDRIPRVLTKVARVHHMGTLDLALRLKLPAAAPYFFAGLKLAVTYGFIAVIASEFILAPSGLGHAIAFAYNDFDNRTMYGLILLLLIVATFVNVALHHWEQKLLRRRGRLT